MKRKNLTLRRAVSLLLVLVMVFSAIPVTAPHVHAADFDWEWVDGEHGTAEAQCPDCGMTYQVTDCETSSDAESALEEFFCDGCGYCAYEGNDECWVKHHCEGCGKCVDEADCCNGCWLNEVTICEDCAMTIGPEFHCPFCHEHYGEGVIECDCEYAILVPHCTDCHEESCVECGVCLVLDGEETPFLTNGGCSEHGLCVACIQYDPDHCRDCWTCETEVCAECGLCEDCADEKKYHCPECGLCYGDGGVEWCDDGGDHCIYCCIDNEWICYECGQCMEGLGLEQCDDCGLCTECCLAVSEGEGCSHGFCIASADYEDHVCPSCMACPDDTECEYCGLCENCQEDYHSEQGICPDGPDWDDHVCPGCSNCFELDDLCQWCGLCEDCREHCRHDICPEDPTAADDGDHFICVQCSNCFEGADRCSFCGLCTNCCAGNTEDVGCSHGLCIESDAFRDHWCYVDDQCLDLCDHNTECPHTNVSSAWSSDSSVHYHICSDCGASVDKESHKAGTPKVVVEPDPLTRKNGTAEVSCTVCSASMGNVSIPYVEIPKDGSPYIYDQPKDYEGRVSKEHLDLVARWTDFSVRAGGEGLTYQWYEKKGSGSFKLINDEENYHTGCDTPTLRVCIPTDACNYNYQYYCVVSNSKGSVTSRTVKINAQHYFGSYKCIDADTHAYCCFGEGCDAIKGNPAKHRFGEWKLIQEATATQQGIKEQRCQDCDYFYRSYLPKLDPDHVHSYSQLRSDITAHWYECGCGARSPAGLQDHTWDGGTVTKAPTEDEMGERTYTCTVCGFKRTEPIARTPHVHEFWMEYSGNRGGKNAYQHYTYCKKNSEHVLADKHSFCPWQYSSPGEICRWCDVCGYIEYQTFERSKNVIMVEGGTADYTVAEPGTKITVTYTQTPGKKWVNSRTGSYWEDMYSEGEFLQPVTLSPSKNNQTVTFTMPNGNVRLVATNLADCDHTGGTVMGEKLEPTCTALGHAPDTLCAVCGEVVSAGASLEPLGHNYPDKPYKIDDRYCSYWKNAYPYHYNSGNVSSYSWYECTRCGKHEQRADRPLLHGNYDVTGLYTPSPGRIWPAQMHTEGAVEATCTRAGKTGNTYCEYCEQLVSKSERIEPHGHEWGAWETIVPASTRTKGKEQRVCAYDGTHVENRILDYTGPDYRLKANTLKLHFDFTYGEQPEPQTVTFTSVGRNRAENITLVDEQNIGYVTTQTPDGLKVTVGAVPWHMIAWLNDDVEILKVCEVDGVKLQEEDMPEIVVSANIRKTAEAYGLQIEGGKAYIYGKDQKTAQSSFSVQGGELINLLPDRFDTFVRWEIVEDESGYIHNYLGTYNSEFESDTAYFYMSPNPVKIKALYQDSPGVYKITYDPNGGSTGAKTSYTDSKGTIDHIPSAYRSGYRFEGWWTEAEGGERVGVDDVVEKNTTLYAHWTKRIEGQYRITFDPNGGAVDPTSAMTTDGKLASLPVASRWLKVFVGWWTLPEGGQEVDENTVFKRDTTVYAHWFSGTIPPPEIEYPLEIDGVKVKDSNRDDILGNGVFSFNENTLTINGSYAGSGHLINNIGMDDLVIYVAKKSVLTCSGELSSAIFLNANTTITGPGKLTIIGGDSGVYMFSKSDTLTIRDVEMEISSVWGVAGPNGENSAKLVIDRASIRAKSRSGACCDFGGGITIRNSLIVKPVDGKIGSSGASIVDESDTVCKICEITANIQNPFVDVKEGAFYYDPVLWAVNANPQITNGVDDTHFGPDRTCTRGQVVTFLWRAAGCPKPITSNNPFTDVKADAFYYKAVLWAVENGITNGTSKTTFGPDQGCTRGQVVTFLWRSEHEPKTEGGANPFTDVQKDKFYYDAVLWAVEKDITKGTDATHFSPDATCTRGQIVTFLYRAVK